MPWNLLCQLPQRYAILYERPISSRRAERALGEKIGSTRVAGFIARSKCNVEAKWEQRTELVLTRIILNKHSRCQYMLDGLVRVLPEGRHLIERFIESFRADLGKNASSGVLAPEKLYRKRH